MTPTTSLSVLLALLVTTSHAFRPTAHGQAWMTLRTPEVAQDRRGFFSSAAASLAVVGGLTVAPVPGAAVITIDPSQVKTTKGGAKFVVVKEGACPAADFTGLAGSCAPKTGSFCIIDYTAFLPDGQVFDTTEKKGGKPLAFKLGEKQVIVGIEQVVSNMLPGEEVQALIPSDLAYGEKGVCTEAGECLVPPNTNLKYFIKLKRVSAGVV